MSAARCTQARRRWSIRSGSAALATALTCLLAVALTAALPGTAQAGSTAVVITVLPGPLSLSAPPEVGLLTTGPAQDRHPALGRPRIHDDRATDATWVVSVTWSVGSLPTGPTPGPAAVTGDTERQVQLGTAVYTERRIDGIDRRTVMVTGVFAGDQPVEEPTLWLTTPVDAAPAPGAATVTYSVS